MKAQSLLIIFVAIFVLAACANTQEAAQVSLLNTKVQNANTQNARTNNTDTRSTKKLDAAATAGLSMACFNQLREQQLEMGEHSNPAQHIALVDRASRCIENLRLHPKHPDNQKAMQLSALAVVNYIKAGDSESAALAFERFRRQFPQQDLLYADYSSFIDTITALLHHDTLASHQIRMLNINESMRDELSRQYHWRRN